MLHPHPHPPSSPVLSLFPAICLYLFCNFSFQWLNCLHPEVEDVALNILQEELEAEERRESGIKSLSGEGGSESEGPQKLTRAQRKRLRKKKLKEDASRRREIIGPLMPSRVDESQKTLKVFDEMPLRDLMLLLSLRSREMSHLLAVIITK